MMSEPETKIEIEDVLASIRRLVSRDASPPGPNGALSHVAPDHGVPDHGGFEHGAPVLARETKRPTAADLAGELAAAAARRGGEPEAVEAAVTEEPASDEPDAGDFCAEELAGMDAVAPDIATPEAGTEVDGAEDFLVLTPSLRVGEGQDEIEEPETMAETDDPSEPAEPRELSEAEKLLAEAEAALEESGAVLDDASNALDPEEDCAAMPTGPLDLGDELSRLESTIAELEAAVAESGLDFDPEEGHEFGADGAAPLSDLPEAFDEEVLQAGVSTEEPLAEEPGTEDPETAVLAMTDGDSAEDGPLQDLSEPDGTVLGEGAAGPEDLHADEETGIDEEGQEVAPEEALAASDRFEAGYAAAPQEDADFAGDEDPDLHDAAWAETPEEEAPRVGMDWAEATLNLARGAAPRRLSLEDAEEAGQAHVGRRSSYDSLRESLELDEDEGTAEEISGEESPAEESMGEEIATGEETCYSEPEFDEAALREMVAQMVRDELRGTLGERITQNVRKLVRREIQRALMGQGYE